MGRSKHDAHMLKLAMHETLVGKGVQRGLSWKLVNEMIDNGLAGRELRIEMDRIIIRYGRD